MEVIDPRFKELERKHDALENTVAQMRGELDEVKRTSSDTSRQTIWQFVIFTVTMGVLMISAIKYQTDTLRNEMNIRFEAMEKRIELSEKNVITRFEDLKQEVRASRKQ
ncbi:MAG: hypothetical protein ACREBD_03510 [Blastocatellia bacterium]